MAKVNLIRAGKVFAPATPIDEEALARVRSGEIIHCEYTKPRNQAFHRRFFALLNLAYEYWEPESGLMPESELNAIIRFAKSCMSADQARGAIDSYVRNQIAIRSERFPSVEKDFNLFREWLVMESGHYELKQTPRGIVKRAKSISFSSMDETEFGGLYKSVFNTAWRNMLQSKFGSEAEAMAAADMMGEFA